MRTTAVLGTFFGLVVLAVLVLGFFYLVHFGVGLYASISTEVTTVSVSAAIASLLSAAIIAGGLHGIGRREDARQRRGVRPLGEQFLRLRAGPKHPVGLPLGDRHFLPHDTQTVEQQMLLLASAGMVKVFLQLRRARARSRADRPRSAAGAGKPWPRDAKRSGTPCMTH
jgi:hypothetical protein